MDSSGNHIYSFDLSRAIAALAVVALHWAELSAPGFAPPFEHSLGFFYRFGALAVPLFFVMSGFVFDWLYAVRIEKRRIDATAFFVLRFSRLYPLFLATFGVVALEFLLAGDRIGYSFDVLRIDIYHALLSIAMMTGWGLEKGFSFNGPSWTVSTEVFLYGAFFMVSRRFGVRPLTIVAMVLAGTAMMPVSVHLAGGLVQFFAGVAAHRLFLRWSIHRNAVWIIVAATAALCLLWLYGNEYYTQSGLKFLRSQIPHISKLETRYQIVRDLIFPALLFPIVVFIQAALERKLRITAVLRHRIVAWMGNVSYSIYLWHYPIMIGFAIVASYAGASPFLFYSPFVFFLYITVLLLLSHLSYYWFERPVMHAIRSRYQRRLKEFPTSGGDISTGVAAKFTMR
jgi:peptidoglycan/LPS O-acetylase OafA/YrhL